MKKVILVLTFTFFAGQAVGDIDDYPIAKSFLNLEHHFDYIILMQFCAQSYQGFPQLKKIAPELEDLSIKIRNENYRKMNRIERKDTDERYNSVRKAFKEIWENRDGNGVPKDIAALSKFYDACGLRYMVR